MTKKNATIDYVVKYFTLNLMKNINYHSIIYLIYFVYLYYNGDKLKKNIWT